MTFEYPDRGPSDYSDEVVIDGDVKGTSDGLEYPVDEPPVPYSLQEKQEPSLEISSGNVAVDLGLRATHLVAALDALDIVDSVTNDLRTGNISARRHYGGTTKMKLLIKAAKQKAMEEIWAAGGYRDLIENGVPCVNARDAYVKEKFNFREKYYGEDNQANRDELRATLTREPEAQTSAIGYAPDEERIERRVDELMDKRGFSYDEARRQAEAELS